jgi:outer membrane protein TolC
VAILVSIPLKLTKAQSSIPQSPLASPILSSSQASRKEIRISLPEAVALGLRDNRIIQSAYLQRVAQRFDLTVAESRFLPQLSISAGVTKTTGPGSGGPASTVSPVATWLAPTGAQVQLGWTFVKAPNAIGPTKLGMGNLSITQPLLQGGGTEVNLAPVRIARLQEQINQLALKSTVINTVTSIILAYRALQQAQEQLQLAGVSRARSLSIMDTNRAMISAGRMAAADLVQTEADVATQDVAVLQAEQARNSAQLTLLQALAIDLHTNLVADHVVSATRVLVPLERVIAIGLGNRVDLLTQIKTVEQNQYNLIIAKNNRLWNLSVVGTAQNGSTSENLGAATTRASGAISSSIGLQLSIPIGDYSAPQAEIQATTAVRVSEVQLSDLKQQVEAAIRDAVQGGEISWRQLVAAQRARALAASALDVAHQKQKAGLASNFEVLSYEAALRAADVQALTSAIAYSNALTILDQQIGTTLETWHISLNG